MSTLHARARRAGASLLAIVGFAITCAGAAHAAVLVDLAIDARARPYGPNDPVTSQQQQFTVPSGPGTLIMTYTEQAYVGGPGGFTLDPKDLSPERLGFGGSTEYTPRSPVKGQLYQVRTIWRHDFSKKVWVASLTARHEYQAFQVRNHGRQIASVQRLTIEFIPGTAPAPPATPPVAQPPAEPPGSGALPRGADQFDSTSILRGDPFNGGEWSNARNGAALAVRTLAQPICIAGLQLESAGTDVTSRGSMIKITLTGPSGASHVALLVEESVINRGFSPGGSGQVLPAQSRTFAPFLTQRIEVAMRGNGWFNLRGLTFSVVPCR